MVPLFISSVTPYSGKNVVTLGLARRFQREGRSVGYFKPVGPAPTLVDGALCDEETCFFRSALNLQEPMEMLCPVIVTEEYTAAALRGGGQGIRERVWSAFRHVSKGKDVVLCMGLARLSAGATLGYPMREFIREAQARLIVVERYDWPMETLDGLLHMRQATGDQLAGVIFNRVPASRVNQVESLARPFLQTQGIETLGILPDDATLSGVSVGELAAALEGKVLAGGDKLDVVVEHFSIGAMNVEAALRFFQRLPNKAVITGGDRADIQMAALETPTRCLILSGGLYPNERILVRADELGVPVILTDRETSATIEICERLHARPSLRGEAKLRRAEELMEHRVNWDLLKSKAGL